MTPGPPGGVPPADADGPAASGPKIRASRRLITVMLLAAATLDLARCGIVLATTTSAGPAARLLMVGAGAATLSLWTARGCHGGRRWSVWAALLIGVASAPQAATTGFRLPYTIPDTATAALGVLLAVTVLATAEPSATKDDSPDGLTRCDTSRPRIGLPPGDAPRREGTQG
jgi:peptidoglycan/LPS O-acetylase OafA/YrhL